MNTIEIIYRVVAAIAVLYAGIQIQRLYHRVDVLEMVVWTLIPEDEEDRDD